MFPQAKNLLSKQEILMFVRSRLLVLLASACLGSTFWSVARAEQGEPGMASPAPGGQVQRIDPSSGQSGESIVIVPQQQATPSYSDAEVRSVAMALVAVDRIAHDYLPSLEAAATPEDEDRVREAAVGEATQAINNSGISVDKYNEILLVARNDPQVADRIRTELQNMPNDRGSAGDGSAPAQGGAGDPSVPASPDNVPADTSVR